MKSKLFLLSLLFAAITVACNQQKKNNETLPEVQKTEQHKSVVVSGVLQNAKDDKPISMAMVIVAGTQIGTITTPEGKFQIEAPEGAKQLFFSAQKFEGLKVDIDAEKEMIVKLQPKTE